MKAEMTPTALKNLAVAEMLENRILPEVEVGDIYSEDILKAGIAFLRGENPHLSGFSTVSTDRWQGAEFVIMLKDTLEEQVVWLRPAITAREVLEWLSPFLAALLHHKDLPRETA